MQNKILITGGTGKLGTELKKHLNGDYMGSADLDFTKKRGSFIIKNTYVDGFSVRSKWEVVETPMKLNDPLIYKTWIDNQL